MRLRPAVLLAALAAAAAAYLLVSRIPAAPPPALPHGPLVALAYVPAWDSSIENAPLFAAEFRRLTRPGIALDGPLGTLRPIALEKLDVREVISLAARPDGRLPDNTPVTLPRLQNYMRAVSSGERAKGPLGAFQSVEPDGTDRFRFTFARQVPHMVDILSDVLGDRAVVGPTRAARPNAPRARVTIAIRLRSEKPYPDLIPPSPKHLLPRFSAVDMKKTVEDILRPPGAKPGLPDGNLDREAVRGITRVDAQGELQFEVETEDPEFRTLALLWLRAVRHSDALGPGIGPLCVDPPDTNAGVFCHLIWLRDHRLRVISMADPDERLRSYRSGVLIGAEIDAAVAVGVDGQRSDYARRAVAVAFNCRREPFADVRVRRALDKAAAPLAAKPAPGPFDPRALGTEREAALAPASGPDEARALLHGAGWADRDKDGVRELHEAPLRFRLAVEAGLSRDLATARGVAATWKEIGAEAVITPLAPAAFRDALARRDFEAALVRLPSPPAADPFALWHSSQWKGGEAGAGNVTGYARKEVDDALEAYGIWQDPSERVAALKRADAHIREDAPAAFLSWEDTVLVTRDPELGKRLAGSR